MSRNRFVDVLKGLLIIIVIVAHSSLITSEQKLGIYPFVVDMTIPSYMLISGFVSACSFYNKKIDNFEKAYNFAAVSQKLLRFVVPFTIAFVVEWILFRVSGLFMVNVFEYGLLAVVFDYIKGGYGQGSYYFPMMIQFVFVFPIIYQVIKKYGFKGLGYCFCANAIYEIMKTAYGMSEGEYRLLIFRYLFAIAAGCFIAIGDIKKDIKTYILSGLSIVIGAAFICLFWYTEYTPKILIYGKATSFIAYLFIIPIMGWLIKKVWLKCGILELMGKASFNIFLVQMIYYNFSDKIYGIIQNKNLQLLFNIVFCVVVGILFYYLDNMVQKLIRKVIEKRKKPI